VTDTIPDGPSKGDHAIWRACFEEYFLRVTNDRPLVDLDPSDNPEGRVPCSRADVNTGSDGRFPACARLMLPERKEKVPPGYPLAADRLREMTACLAPMRHVLIEFKYQREQVSGAQKQTTL
jgi:hypothetical protein